MHFPELSARCADNAAKNTEFNSPVAFGSLARIEWPSPHTQSYQQEERTAMKAIEAVRRPDVQGFTSPAGARRVVVAAEQQQDQ